MLWEANYMPNFINLLKNKQIIICVTTALLLVVALAFLLNLSPKEDYTEFRDELVTVSNNIRLHYKLKPDYWGLNNENVIKNKLVRENMVRNKKIISVTGREFIIGQNEKGDTVMPTQRNFMITLDNLNKRMCKKVSLVDIYNENNLALQKIIIRNDKQIVEFEWGGNNPLPITDNNVEKYCKSKNSISWVFE